MTEYFKGLYRTSILLALYRIAFEVTEVELPLWGHIILGLVCGIIGIFSVTDKD